MQSQIKSIALPVLAILSLAGCGSPTSNASGKAERDPEDYKSWLIARTEVGVKARLRDPDTAEFSDVHTTTYQGAEVVCGHVNAKNGFGGMTGRQKFVGTGDTVFVEEDGASAVQEAWSMMGC